MIRRLKFSVGAAFCLVGLAGCAAPAPMTQADQADIDACTAQADATYNAQNFDQLSRTSQNGLRYGATPTHVFDAQQMGALHARDSQLTDCETNGDPNRHPIIGAQIVTPRIVGQ